MPDHPGNVDRFERSDIPREPNPSDIDARDVATVEGFADYCRDRGRSGVAIVIKDRKGGLVGDMPAMVQHATGDAGTLLLGTIEWIVRFIVKCGDLKVCELADGTLLTATDFVRFMFEARLLAVRRQQEDAGIDPAGSPLPEQPDPDDEGV